MSNSDKLVLVTGASGFVGSNAVKTLLEQGYRVRGTVRSVKNEEKIKPLKELCPQAAQNLHLVEADLIWEESWLSAVQGCDFVLHIASPVVTNYKHEDELIKPAVQGTLNVLKAVAATKGAVKRVVITSSVAAICYGSVPTPDTIYSEEDWTNPQGKDVDAYIKSKYLAEKAAWDFVAKLNPEEKFDITTICPGLILGPLVTNIEGESAQLIKRMLSGKLPMVPHYFMPIVDVRDVAQAHVIAMTEPQAANQRIILSAGTHWFKEIAEALNAEFASKGYWIGTREAPYVLLWVMSWFDSVAGFLLRRHGISYGMDNSKLKKLLKMQPIPMAQSAVEMAYSLIDKGLVPKKF